MKPDRDISARWSALVCETVGDMTNIDVVERIKAVGTEISDSTVGNWVRNENFGTPSPDKVIGFARAFGVPVPKALLVAGLIEEHEFKETIVARRDVSDMSADEMVDNMIMMLARIRDIVDAAPPPSGSSRKRRPRHWPRGDRPAL